MSAKALRLKLGWHVEGTAAGSVWLVGSGGAENSRRDERGSQGQITGSLWANGKAFGFSSENKKTLECLCKGVTESVLLLRKILLDLVEQNGGGRSLSGSRGI